MKAYAIKNKEGKYWRSKFDKEGNILLTDDIVDAMPYEEDELKMLECPKDCTIVPITICEGDLEEELQTTQTALFNCCERLLEYIQPKYTGLEFVEALYSSFIKQAKESEKDERD